MRVLLLVREAHDLRKKLAAMGEATEPPDRAPARGPPYWASRALRIRADVDAAYSNARCAWLAPLVERSRSGNGAHVWFFFSEPIAAAVVDVAMSQSLVRREAVADLVASYGQVIVDECHHLPAVQFDLRCEKAGVEHCSMNDLRRTFATPARAPRCRGRSGRSADRSV